MWIILVSLSSLFLIETWWVLSNGISIISSSINQMGVLWDLTCWELESLSNQIYLALSYFLTLIPFIVLCTYWVYRSVLPFPGITNLFFPVNFIILSHAMGLCLIFLIPFPCLGCVLIFLNHLKKFKGQLCSDFILKTFLHFFYSWMSFCAVNYLAFIVFILNFTFNHLQFCVCSICIFNALSSS